MKKRRPLAGACGAINLKFFTQRRKDAKNAKGEERVVVRKRCLFFHD